MTIPLSPLPSDPTGPSGSANPPGSTDSAQSQSLYEAIGGEDTFQRIVHEFYRQIPSDPVLGPMYPAEDLAGAEDRLRWFLIQYWGGPQTFNAQRGHPRLRIRHQNFTVDATAREHWLTVMSRALATIEEDVLPDPARKAMWDHMVRVADMLINSD